MCVCVCVCFILRSDYLFVTLLFRMLPFKFWMIKSIFNYAQNNFH